MTDKNYSRFPIKIYEIILTTFLINSLFTVLLTIGGIEQNIFVFLARSPLIIFAPIYLVFIYKVLLENEDILLKSTVRYLTYSISVCAIFLSIFQMQEIVPILKEENMDSFRFGIEYNEGRLWHPLITVMILCLSLVVYWYVYKKERNRDIDYYLIFIATLVFIEGGTLIALFPPSYPEIFEVISNPVRVLILILCILSFLGLAALITLVIHPGSFGMLRKWFKEHNKGRDRE